MRAWVVAVLAVLLLTGCASGGPETRSARRQGGAAPGREEVVARADGKTYYFNNNPDPFCFAFDVPGD